VPHSASEGYFGPKVTDHATTPTRLPPIQAPKDFVSQLASRLKHCEAENENLKTLLARANKHNRDLEEQVRLLSESSLDSHRVTEELAAMRAYVSQLQDQIFGMEEFLRANGLVWVEDWKQTDASVSGGDPPSQSESAESGSSLLNKRHSVLSVSSLPDYAQRNSEPLPKPSAQPISQEDRDVIISQLDSLSKEPWRCPPREAIEKAVIDLNRRVGVEARMREYGGGKVLSYSDRPVIPVTIYENGIFVKRGPFRSFETESARLFVEDLAAGYLPSEFKASYPEGINLEIRYAMDQKFEPATKPAVFGKGGRRLDECQSDCTANAPSGEKMMLAMNDRGILSRVVRDQTAEEIAELRAAYAQVRDAPRGEGKSVHSLLSREDDLQKPMGLAHFLRKLPASVNAGGRVVPIRAEVERLARGSGGEGDRVENLGGTLVIESTAFVTGGSGASEEEASSAPLSGDDPDTLPASVARSNPSSDLLGQGESESAAPAVQPLATLRLRVHSSDAKLQNRNILIKCPFAATVRSVLQQAARAIRVAPSAASLLRPFGGDLMQLLDSTLEAAGLTPNARLFLMVTG